ncbi:MAG: DUF234 domain-containing protein [Bacteroidales bacterium]|nr:DUF234 domain-containing protein [Bacteroidales bacterium]
MSKEGTHNVRYDISDNFLKLLFRYYYMNKSVVEIRNFALLRKIIEDDYETFSVQMLERYFRRKMTESLQFASIGSWRERKKGSEANEVDLVSLPADGKTALVAEVKRQRRNYAHNEFMRKVECLKNSVLAKFDVDSRLLTLDDSNRRPQKKSHKNHPYPLPFSEKALPLHRNREESNASADCDILVRYRSTIG